MLQFDHARQPRLERLLSPCCHGLFVACGYRADRERRGARAVQTSCGLSADEIGRHRDSSWNALIDAPARLVVRAVTLTICYVTDLRRLSLDELAALRVSVEAELRSRRASNCTCVACGARFVARKDARHCSSRCRVAAHRLRQRKGYQMRISGIGYQGLTLDAFVSRLRLRGVVTLVDVRLNAISRKRGFSKRALSEALVGAGIAYVHLPMLGNQRDNRAGYAELDSVLAHEVRERFRQELNAEEASKALREVADLAQAGEVAIFCYEEDERHCHREQVIERVRAIISGALATT